MEIWTFWTWWMTSYSEYVKCPIVVETQKFNVLQNGCMWSALVAVETESTPNGGLSVAEARRTFLKNQTCFKIREKEKGKNRVDFCSKRLLLTSFGGQQMCLNKLCIRYEEYTARRAAYVRVVVKWLHLACAFPCAARASHEMAFQNKKQLARAKNVFGFFDQPSH